jgi:prevent-host-death family protein
MNEPSERHRCLGNRYQCATMSTIIVAMADRVSTIEVRQRIGDMLNRVALRHDEFIIERKGKPLAALVPVERLEQMRRFARRHALDVMERQKGGTITDDQAMELGLEAQRWARQQVRRKSRAKAK